MRNELSDQDKEIDYAMGDVLSALAHLTWAKSNDRTERDRSIAIAITDLEKVHAWLMYIRTPGDANE